MSEIEESYPLVNGPSWTDDERAAIARAMSDPHWRPRFILPDNSKGDFAASVEEAVRSQRPFMVKARADILVIDDDSGEELAAQFAEEYLGDFEPVLCWSGRANHQHLYVVIDYPDHQVHYVKAARSFGLTGSAMAKWIRSPGAPHRLGGHSRPVANQSVDEIVLSLRREPRSLVIPLGHKALTALYVGKDAYRSVQWPDGDASHALTSATLGLVNARYTEDEMWQLLRRHPGGEKLRSRIDQFYGDERKTRAWWVKYHVEPARKKVALRPTVSSPADALAIVQGARSWMEARSWPGVGGANDRCVLTAFLDKAEELRRAFDIGMSVRELAERAGLASIGTTTRAVHRLTKLGVLAPVAAADSARDPDYHGPRANRYSITLPSNMSEAEQEAWRKGTEQAARESVLEQSESGGARLTAPVVTTRRLMAHDAFRNGALTKSKLAVWQCLEANSPRTTRQVADQLKYKTIGTPSKHLKALAIAGLALRTPGGWVRLDRDLDEVAADFGTTGKSEMQQRAHQAQRARNSQKFSVSNVSEFVAQHVRAGGNRSAVIDHHQMRAEYRANCYLRRERRQPAHDKVLIAEIQRCFPKAVFHPQDVGRFLTAGHWKGLRLVGSPSMERREVIERQMAQTGGWVWSDTKARPPLS